MSKKNFKKDIAQENSSSHKNIISYLFRYRVAASIILLSMVPLIWFRPWDHLITIGDFWLPLSPISLIKATFTSWSDKVGSGFPNGFQFNIFPWFSFWALLKSLFLPLDLVEKIWFIFLFLVSGFSIYSLIKVIVGRERSYWVYILPVIIYLFNPYIMIVGTNSSTALSYAFTPFVLFVCIKSIKSYRPVNGGMLLALSTIFLTSAAANPPIYVIPFLTLLLYLIYRVIVKGLNRHIVTFSFSFVVFYLLFNIWWLITFFHDLVEQSESVKSLVDGTSVGFISPLHDLIRLFGSWAFFSGFAGALYFPFSSNYLNPFIITLTYIIPITVLIGFITIQREKRKIAIFFLFVGILGIVLSHGEADDIFGSFFGLLKSWVPFFWVFREPFAKFGALTSLSYSILISGIAILMDIFLKKFPVVAWISGFIVALVIIVVAWPMVTGEHYPDARGMLAGSRVKIPAYWMELSNWLETKDASTGRLMVLPRNPDSLRSGIPYNWGYGSADVSPLLLSNELIEVNNGYYGYNTLSDKLARSTYDSIHESSSSADFSTALNFLGVSKVLVRGDLDLRRAGGYLERKYDPEVIKKSLLRNSNFVLEKKFGPLEIYDFTGNDSIRKIYAADKTVCMSGNLSKTSLLMSILNSNEKVAIVSGNNADAKYCERNFNVPLSSTNAGSLRRSEDYSYSFNNSKVTYVNYNPPFTPSEHVSDQFNYFVFQIDNSGEYDLYTELISGENYEITVYSTESGKVINSVTGVKGPEKKGLYNVGRYSLGRGVYEIAFQSLRFRSLVSDGSFEKSSWKSGITGDFLPTSDDAYSGKHSLVLGPGSTDAYYTFPKGSYEDTTYLISFYYKFEGSNPPTFFVWENNCSSNGPIWVSYQGDVNSCSSNFIPKEALSTTSEWRLYQTEFVPESINGNEVGIGFAYVSSENGKIVKGSGKTLIDNILIQTKSSKGGNIILAEVKDAGNKGTPNISFAKKSNAEYVVRVTGATGTFPLVFSESYDTDWEAYIIDKSGKKKIFHDKHLVANSFANLWIVEETGDFDVLLKYSLEDRFRIAVLISLVSIISSVVYLLRVVVKRRSEI